MNNCKKPLLVWVVFTKFGWFWVVLAGFAWLWVVLPCCGWFSLIACFITNIIYRVLVLALSIYFVFV